MLSRIHLFITILFLCALKKVVLHKKLKMEHRSIPVLHF